MLAEGLAALAAAGGAAVVQAAGTSAWDGLQQSVAQWFARGDGERRSVELERLDRSAAALESAQDDEQADVRSGQRGAWQARFEQALENLSDSEREEAAEILRALLRTHAPADGAAPSGGPTISGNVDIRADHGSAAAVQMGDVTVGTPPQPGPQLG
ncbi:hypothetical protein K7395_02485 [Streptomyces filamentosus]|uniref:Uncharacterized protein n=2 Tax=Streptomyces filamentosus TaxID=67294 RepID=A0ABY4UNF9_STRFL|nr:MULTISPECIES: hypothetical protein [Streptomyces]ESU50736.1 hypothetical protein P376_1287 [Streptomyces sp. HCCB10043]MYR82894.1 hypothetical protein [Streptomyces sp. SID5466]USC45673.1 hypothetical protein K7395_02485 [Streptomyces filamentosus]